MIAIFTTFISREPLALGLSALSPDRIDGGHEPSMILGGNGLRQGFARAL